MLQVAPSICHKLDGAAPGSEGDLGAEPEHVAGQLTADPGGEDRVLEIWAARGELEPGCQTRRAASRSRT